jgi:16S rRNA (uracil1498-N3)-methyltransferase
MVTNISSFSLILHKTDSMEIFYAPDISGKSYTLDEKESKHVVRVLRMAKNQEVRLIDGRGNLYNGIIVVPDQKECKIQITGIINNYEKRPYKLHIAISPLKNPERFEWFIEKSVEIGIDEITPLICKNTEKTGIKAERINNIIISAMKQSLKATITVLNDPCTFKEFINRQADGLRMIAHCEKDIKRQSIAEVYKNNMDALILIGPEGDFRKEEIELAVEKGYQPVHLGSSRLRTETAGVAACHSIYFMNQ